MIYSSVPNWLLVISIIVFVESTFHMIKVLILSAIDCLLEDYRLS